MERIDGEPPPQRRSEKPTLPVGFTIDVVQHSYQLWLTTKARFTPTERQRLFGLTIVIGGVCGLVASRFTSRSAVSSH